MSSTLKIYNTLTRTKEPFKPLDERNVRMYVCGPTVYDYAHIGNARPLIVFDVLYRLLRHLYGAGHVKYVRNITDVDDKINARAAERGISIRELTEETNRVFQADVRALGCLDPDVQPRATEHIAQMIDIIRRLIDSGHAYAADGHVLFDVPSMPSYGQLSRRSLEDMRAGARVDVAPYKRGDMDFVLWKPSSETEPGWDSPWGRGRPGWHIECSAMSWKHLGEMFDIHGGGIDLVFPHHENEIAQSCCAFGQDVMARYWMHNGFLQVEGEKMSKSLGNFVTIHELLHTDKFGGRKWPGEVLRLAMLRTHYRQPIDWTVKALEEAEANLLAWHDHKDFASVQESDVLPETIVAALCEELNTAETISAIHSLNKTGQISALKSALRFLGVLNTEAFSRASDQFDPLHDLTQENRRIIESRIEARLAARAARNWAESDRIRDELAEMGVALKDNKDGTTTWDVKR